MTEIICGVDVSSETLDGCIGLEGPRLSVKRTPRGVAKLRSFCRDHGVELVVMEATGGYERLVFGLLWEAGQPCAVVNPRQVRRFAEAMGYLEKTDAIDAAVIAGFARARGIVAQEPAGPAQQRLKALVVRLRQLTGLKVAQMNQRRLVQDSAVLASLDEVLELVRRQIKDLERRVAELLADDPLWRALEASFRQTKGVAGRTIACLAAEMPEIGLYSNKAIAKLAGLAPMARDSGKLHGKRTTRGGRAGVRTILVTIAAVAARYDPDMAAFHKRLIEAGKPRMTARIAVAHKLLVRLNAKARDVRAQLATA